MRAYISMLMQAIKLPPFTQTEDTLKKKKG
jgi:hypothetical protein